MRKGPLNFLGRKNQSLYDTNIKFKDMDNVELVLESSAIPESGTASVRARPTVKHHSPSSFESFQGFNVPTPKVPLLPPANGPKINGSVGEDRLSNGSVVSVPDVEEGDIFVPPPPPSMAPPPPPFIPPPDFMGDLNSLDMATLQPPSMPAPKPTSLAPSMEENFTFLKPPPMAPPKPPSTCSSGSASSVPISSPPPAIIPEHPKFAPPQPPSERQHKTFKTPPPKPIRLSSISNLDSPPQTPAPPPPVQTPTLSTFNPQNTAKLYNTPQTSILSGYEDRDTRPKKMLVLEDSGSVKPAPLLVQVDGKAPKVTTPSKPVSKDVQELKENLNITQPSPSPPPEPNKVAKTGAASVPPEIEKPLQTVHQTSPQLQKVNGTPVHSEPSKDKLEVTPSQSCKFSPLLDRKLRNLKSSETSGARDGPVASPLALLMAAKERDKHRSNQSLSRENSGKKNEQPSASIHPSDSNPNSFIVTPRSSSSSSLTSQDTIQESPKSARPVEYTQTTQTPQKSSSPALVRDPKPFASPVLNSMTKSKSVTSLIEQKQNEEQSPSKSQSSQLEENKEGLNMPVLPPPPEFGDFDDIVGPPPSMLPPDPPMKKAPTPGPPVGPPPSMIPPDPPMKKAPTPGSSPPPPPSMPPPDPPMKKASTPGHFVGPHPSMPPPDPPMKKASTPGQFVGPHPSMPPPDPPMKKAPTPAVSLPPPAPVPSPPPPPKPPAAPKLPLPDADIKPKPQVQTKPKVASPQLPANLSPSQATLLSILQKKMLEMDHKMAPVKEAESSSDDWGTPLSDEDNKVPVVPKGTPQNKISPVVNKAPALDMRELESKVVRKYQETSSLRFPTSNGPSKHKYGMTFTVRPGTRNPITPYSKENS